MDALGLPCALGGTEKPREDLGDARQRQALLPRSPLGQEAAARQEEGEGHQAPDAEGRVHHPHERGTTISTPPASPVAPLEARVRLPC